MTTIRVAKRHRWTAIDRRTINDKRLSYKARGVLVWLLDKPDGWTVNSEAMSRQSIDGKYAVRTALQELEALGYLRRTRSKDERGQWVNACEVFEVPTVSDDSATKPDDQLLDGVQLSAVGLSDVGKPDFKTKEQTDVAMTNALPDPPDEEVKAVTKEDREKARAALSVAKKWAPGHDDEAYPEEDHG